MRSKKEANSSPLLNYFCLIPPLFSPICPSKHVCQLQPHVKIPYHACSKQGRLSVSGPGCLERVWGGVCRSLCTHHSGPCVLRIGPIQTRTTNEICFVSRKQKICKIGKENLLLCNRGMALGYLWGWSLGMPCITGAFHHIIEASNQTTSQESLRFPELNHKRQMSGSSNVPCFWANKSWKFSYLSTKKALKLADQCRVCTLLSLSVRVLALYATRLGSISIRKRRFSPLNIKTRDYQSIPSDKLITICSFPLPEKFSFYTEKIKCKN